MALCALAAAQTPAAAIERNLFDQINREREHAGVAKLEWNPLLAEAARAHAKRSADHLTISHQFPGEPALEARIAAAGLRFDTCAENVAVGHATDAIHEGLMKSAGHRANLLNGDFNAIGIGVAERDGELYVAENFVRALASYSEAGFRETLIATIQRARQAAGIPPIDVSADARLRDAACAESSNAEGLAALLPGVATVAIFTAADPAILPHAWDAPARDKTMQHMTLGVCFRPGEKHGYGNFFVAAAFYREP
jgi:hypothetical protein